MEAVLRQLETLRVCPLCLVHCGKLSPMSIPASFGLVLNELVSINEELADKNVHGKLCGAEPPSVCWLCANIIRKFDNLYTTTKACHDKLNQFISQNSSASKNYHLLNNSRLSRSRTTTTDSIQDVQVEGPTSSPQRQLVIRHTLNDTLHITEIHANDDDDEHEIDSDDEVLADLKRDKAKTGEKRSTHKVKRKKQVKSIVEDKARKRGKNDRFRKVIIEEEEMLLDREKDRVRKWYVQGTHKCDTCLIGYYNQKHLLDHNRSKHNPENRYACEVCQQRFGTEREMKRHRLGHRSRLQCVACGERLGTHRDMWRHHVAQHGLRQDYTCHQCGGSFRSRPSLAYHRRCEHRDRPHCDLCGKTFRNQTTYRRHQRLHVPTPRVTCPTCGGSYRTRAGLRTHQLTHGPAPPEAYCSVCHVQYKHVFQYRRHLKVSAKHAAIQNGDTDDERSAHKYSCDTCGKRFISPSARERHNDSVHLKLRRHRCSLCDKDYATPAALWTHRRARHDRRPRGEGRVCEYCGRVCATDSALAEHVRVHSDARPYACGTCGATFKRHSGRYMHARLSHAAPPSSAPRPASSRPPSCPPRPMQCPLCPASYRHPSGLYLHRRLHHAAKD